MAAAFGAAMSAGATEQLFIGQVQKIVVRPTGTEGCPKPKPCEEEEPLPPPGMTRVCLRRLSNCQATDLQVREVFLGDLQPGKTTTVNSHPGEFTTLVFPSSSAPVLVILNGASHRWAEIKTRDGQLFFKPVRGWTIGGIKTETLPADADGMVSLDELLARVRAVR